MKWIIAALLMFAFLVPAHAEYQARDPAGNVVTLESKPCENAKALLELPKLNQILLANGFSAATPEHLRSGMLVHNGKPYGVCWLAVGDIVIVLDDSGEKDAIFPVPIGAFQPAHTL